MEVGPLFAGNLILSLVMPHDAAHYVLEIKQTWQDMCSQMCPLASGSL